MEIVNQLEVAKFIKRQEIFNQSLEYAISQLNPELHAKFSEIYAGQMTVYSEWVAELKKLMPNLEALSDHATPLNP